MLHSNSVVEHGTLDLLLGRGSGAGDVEGLLNLRVGLAHERLDVFGEMVLVNCG